MSTVLLIDDDEDMLLMTGRWLEKAGHQVVKAPSGEEALRLLSEERPDLILLDYAMPGMSGPEVLKEIRSKTEGSPIPVLYRTGMDDAADMEGFAAYEALFRKALAAEEAAVEEMRD